MLFNNIYLKKQLIYSQRLHVQSTYSETSNNNKNMKTKLPYNKQLSDELNDILKITN